MKESFKESFIDFMIDSRVLTFGDFQTKSGRMSPYFINTGNYSTGKKISTLGKYYAKFIKENISMTIIKGDNLCLFGPAYKGIPLVVTTSAALYEENELDIPYVFNRKENKDHGEKGMLVGHAIQPGQSVLIVEDVITAGTALREAITFLRCQENIKIEGVVVSVDRMEKGNKGKSAVEEIQDEYGIPVLSLVTISDILEVLKKKKANKNILFDTLVAKGVLPDEEILEKMEVYIKKYGRLEL